MEYTQEELERKIQAQKLICTVNGWLLEHYEEQKAEQLKQDKDRGRGTDQSFAPPRNSHDKELYAIL